MFAFDPLGTGDLEHAPRLGVDGLGQLVKRGATASAPSLLEFQALEITQLMEELS
jgi:hypothetical protein